MTVLQNFLFPEPGICTEHDLYYRASGPAGYSRRDRAIRLGGGGVLRFDTYFNLLNIGKWHGACALSGLFAEIRGEGRVEIRILQTFPGRSTEVLYCEIAALSSGRPHRADISHYADISPVQGLIWAEIRALDMTGASITGGAFVTGALIEAPPELAISITTFHREEQIRATVARLEHFLAGFAHGDHVRVLVVDNGDSAPVSDNARVRRIANPNYGGSGGFARGLIEAGRAGCSHCLFMDDDAAFHMENIARAYAFLALARDARTALAGAMITNTHKWAMWENGALFDGLCRPLHGGTDLRERSEVFAMEHESARPQPATLYGGWWFFAFSVKAVRHYPFPFFVRGDDVSFALMNDFRITLLNGVVSFQEDFFEKESAQTQYLDLRSHMVHLMVSDRLARSGPAAARTALRLVMRSLLRLHYDSAEVQLMAWADMMEGPGFFEDNLDMKERRARIRAMAGAEMPASLPHVPPERRRLARLSRKWRTRIGVWTLNGHLLPFSGYFWDRITLGIGERGSVYPALGAARITCLDHDRKRGYTVAQSKRRFFALGWRMAGLLWRFLREQEALKAAWREGYGARTTRIWWEETLNLPAESAESSARKMESP